MNTGYLIYQAERTRSRAEQREIDRRNGEFAAAATRRWHRIAAALAGRVTRALGAGPSDQAPSRTQQPQPVMQKCP
jgi:hypothetical protein